MRLIIGLLSLAAGLLGLSLAQASASPGPVVVTLATAGPGSLSHLPVELMSRIGADKDAGLKVNVRFFGGGPLAYRDMLDRNSDFAVAGAPALAELRVKGAPVVSIAAVNRVPTFALLVRKGLEKNVRRSNDLKGRVIGVNSSSRKVRSTSQQIAEYLLRRAGVPLDQVHFVPAGQSLEEQRAALIAGSIDALMGDEPFVSQMAAEGLGYVLIDLHEPETCRRELGGLFLNAQLATRADVVENNPELARRMVKALSSTLKWIAAHEAKDIAHRLYPDDAAQRERLTQLLSRHKAIYSPDGAFTQEQIATAEAFWRANQQRDGGLVSFRFTDMIDPRFAGMRRD